MICGGFGYGPYGGFGDPWGAVISIVVTLLFFGGLIALAIWAVRSFTRRPTGADSAMEVLRRRLAAGEIPREEYEKIRKALQG
jgi:putative membrane protein